MSNVVTLKALSEPAVVVPLLPGMMKSVGVGLWDEYPRQVEEGGGEWGRRQPMRAKPQGQDVV